MRALCGAIIVAGSLIGLGLLNVGIGQRWASLPYYQQQKAVEGDQSAAGDGNKPVLLHSHKLSDMDTVFLVSLFALLCTTAIGLGITFLGLAYHHHRRHLEMLHLHRGHGPAHPPERVTV